MKTIAYIDNKLINYLIFLFKIFLFGIFLVLAKIEITKAVIISVLYSFCVKKK